MENNEFIESGLIFNLNSKVALSVSKATLSIPLGEYTRAMQILKLSML